MVKTSNREKLLTEGLRVVHRHGFAGASVRDIVAAAGVPQGSFTNHFASKEAFGLEILDLYYANARRAMAETLLDESLPPLERLRAYIDGQVERVSRNEMRNGCLFGNFTAEASEASDAIRTRVVEIFGEVRATIAGCLRAAVRSGEITRVIDCEDIAAFIVSSMQGAILLSKAYRSAEPIERFRRILFSMVLA